MQSVYSAAQLNSWNKIPRQQALAWACLKTPKLKDFDRAPIRFICGSTILKQKCDLVFVHHSPDLKSHVTGWERKFTYQSDMKFFQFSLGTNWKFTSFDSFDSILSKNQSLVVGYIILSRSTADIPSVMCYSNWLCLVAPDLLQQTSCTTLLEEIVNCGRLCRHSKLGLACYPNPGFWGARTARFQSHFIESVLWSQNPRTLFHTRGKRTIQPKLEGIFCIRVMQRALSLGLMNSLSKLFLKCPFQFFPIFEIPLPIFSIYIYFSIYRSSRAVLCID